MDENSASVRERVIRARQRQQEYLQMDGLACNAQLRGKELNAHCRLDKAGCDLLKMALNQFSLSVRSREHILKVGHTIADLDGSDMIQLPHIAEAISYRTLDRKLFW